MSKRTGTTKNYLARSRHVQVESRAKSPRINNRVGARALRWAVTITGFLTRDWRPAIAPGREERLARLVRQQLASSILMLEADRAGGVQIHVAIRTAFGKPALVSVDLAVTETQRQTIEQHLFRRLGDDPSDEDHRRRSYHLFLIDAMERTVQTVWDNPELAPVAMRGRVVFTDDTPEKTLQTVHLDMTDLGYQDETARPEDLFARLGAPASDPRWHP